MSLKKEEFEIPATEDLMKEHGLLNRVLLIYEEIINRISNNIDFQVTVLNRSLEIIKLFVEDYHEKMEEDYIFPIFERNKQKVRLVKTLRNQHNKGREITNKLKDILITKETLDAKTKRTVKSLLKKFINMYRPHETREDTELFPEVRNLISEDEFKNISEIFERTEHEKFGESGFEAILKTVEDLEKNLGIYQLEKFTPEINNNHT